MSVNAFPLSPQAGTTWRHAYSSHIYFSAKGASLNSCSPSSFCRTIQIGRNLCFIYRRRNRNPWINNSPRISILVCSAWAYSNGCKSLTSPNSGNRIANSKGVHREVESERSWRQTSDLTHRNFIQGIWPWMRLQDKSKSHSYSEWLV